MYYNTLKNTTELSVVYFEMNSRQIERYLIMMSDIVECFYVYSEFRSYLFIGHVYKQTKVLMIDFVSILEMMFISITA